MADREKIQLAKEVMTELYKIAAYYRKQAWALEQKLMDRDSEIERLKTRLAQEEKRLDQEWEMRENYMSAIVKDCRQISQSVKDLQKSQDAERMAENDKILRILANFQSELLEQLRKPTAPETPSATDEPFPKPDALIRRSADDMSSEERKRLEGGYGP